MHFIDYLIFAAYMIGILWVGFYFYAKNKNTEDYFVGSRKMEAHHVGLSVVATDVGGGFSIGLGGLGFAMGLSGSWLLFTGLVGAWLAAVLIVPKIKRFDIKYNMYTYPDFLRVRYNSKVALLAAIVSGLGYLGFAAAQLLAGAKLASGTMITHAPFGLSTLEFAIYLFAVVTILYTVIGGLKAVIYTDTVQWIILLVGLIFFTIPITLYKIGGFQALKNSLPPEFFTLTNVEPVTVFNWMITIIPIWVIAMTLYQRIYSCKDEETAKKAWYIAGIFEYPIMAFTGVFLGMCAKFLFPSVEAEMGLPMLIKNVLPIGVTGIVIASYFSAIMSTVDSCLMASSGNFVNDIIQRYNKVKFSEKTLIRLSQVITLIIGILAIIIAGHFKGVLDIILYSYSFMVSGLFIPTLGGFFWKKGNSKGAMAGIILGGATTLLLENHIIILPEILTNIGLSSVFYGIVISAIAYILGSLATKQIDF